MNRRGFLGVLGSIFAVGCSNPQPSEDMTVEKLAETYNALLKKLPAEIPEGQGTSPDVIASPAGTTFEIVMDQTIQLENFLGSVHQSLTRVSAVSQDEAIGKSLSGRYHIQRIS